VQRSLSQPQQQSSTWRSWLPWRSSPAVNANQPPKKYTPQDVLVKFIAEATQKGLLTSESLNVLREAILSKNVKMSGESLESQKFWAQVTTKLQADKKGLQNNLDTFMFSFNMPIVYD